MIHRFGDHAPRLAPDVFIAPGAHVIGDVEIGAGSSIWFNTVVRGDVFHVRIGQRTNVQDLSLIHVTTGKHATLIGDEVTIGHRALIHGCTIENRCLIGMGAILMDRVVIGEESIVAAGAVVTEGTVIPPGTLALGFPAKPRRELSDAERAHLGTAARKYAALAATYRAETR
jgi:carbonic anhydrase/acetyltransferase-like protein (isoleucine patch superfamily)